MKHIYILLVSFFLLSCLITNAQTPATRTTVLGLGSSTCAGGTNGIEQFSYNAATNVLTQNSLCTPNLTASGSSGTFSLARAGIDFNPKDGMIYYYKKVNVSGTDNTYIWRWDPAGACPVSLPIFQTFLGENLAMAFDAQGNAWVMKLTAQPTVPVTNLLSMRKIDFSTMTIGTSVSVNLPSGVNIYTSNGDYLITPGGNMFFAYDNKLLTVNYQAYDGVNPLTATYIDTIKLPSANQNLVGLAYANGEFVGSFKKTGTCGYGEIDILTGVRTPVTIASGGTFSSVDNSSITSGVGVAKNLVSVTPTMTPGRYTVVYDVFVKNYGNYPVNNIQVIDSLQYINGLGNVVAGSVSTSFISNPGGLLRNTSYNGTTDARLLAFSPAQMLVNTPLSNNNFTIRVTADITGIVKGTIYYNSAVATGTGFASLALRDSSTNGTNPDLDLNEKPDDPGESVKTPFVITVASETPPCATLTTVMHSQDFGTGANSSSMPPGSSTQYTGSLVNPLAKENFILTSNPSPHNGTYWNSLTDHTSGTGRMMVVNADVNSSVIYSATINGLCADLKYSFSAYVANISNASQVTFCNAVGGFKQPKLTFRVRDAVTGLLLTNISTGDITNSSWTQYGMRFVLPPGTPNVIIEILNEGAGGCGNDVAIDDISFGLCDSSPTVSLSTTTSGCLGGSTTFSANVADPTVIGGTTYYQWQISSDSSSWSNIFLAIGSSYNIPSTAAGDIGKFYRVIIATGSQMNTLSGSCRYFSPGFKLLLKSASSAPTSISQSRTTICPGDPVRLTVTGGSLGAGAVWKWYTGGCGNTAIGTGPSIIVSPSVVTTYYVRAEGSCNTTTCAQVTLTFSCDIDDDDDGIPDMIEGNGVDPSADEDSDGILNYRDTDFSGGFIDSNSDGVNDIFDNDKDSIPNHLDLDSDNDGIPDVVESGGVDVNGDGKIDNYSDTDADGFSQNVDGNNTGATGSGNGLGALDTDGDGIPNYFDLDSDNDGIPDVIEAYGPDTNNDGIIDGFTDSDGDGLANSVDGDVGNDGTPENSANALLRTGGDANNDGRADSYPYKNMDADSKSNPYDLDSDGDGITDVKEAFPTLDTNNDGRIDGTFNSNGWGTIVAAMGSLNLPNSDGSGRANPYDIDSDDDGIPDNIEGLPTAAYMLPSGTDTDGDGIDNSYDNSGSFGGNGIPPVDTDGDSIPDYKDLDTDGDGSPDVIEGNDFNLNGLPDDNVSLTGVDTDGDGLDNRFDLLNSSVLGTSAYMGNGGSFTGPGSPGSRSTVQRTLAAYVDRDWRTVYVLNCQYTKFNAVLRQKTVYLNWSVLCEQEVDYFIIERSTDGVSFAYANLVDGKPNNFSKPNDYNATDDVTGISGQAIYYRLKTIDVKSKVTYSNTVTLQLSKETGENIRIMPNPVKDQLKLLITSAKRSNAEIRIFDANGKVLMYKKQQLSVGENSIFYPETSALLDGSYYIRINIEERVIMRKFNKLK